MFVGQFVVGGSFVVALCAAGAVVSAALVI